MSGEFLLVLIVAGSYLAAHWAFEWLGHRYMLVSGAEYLLLGILLGPQVSACCTRACSTPSRRS
jgi:hypothetical protein